MKWAEELLKAIDESGPRATAERVRILRSLPRSIFYHLFGEIVQTQNPCSPEYLRRYSGQHLLYEVDMFFQLGHLLMAGQFIAREPNLTIVLRNGIIEAFVLHLRNILDFFYTTPRKSDVGATMFYDGLQLPPKFPPKSVLLNEAHRRAHKEMSHLTTERHWEGDPRKVWEFARLMREVQPLLKMFLETASPTRVDPIFVAQTKALLSVP